MKYLASAAAGLLLLASATAVRAQSTDGYHSIQVFPVVVDSASFAQRFNFTTPNLFPVTVKVKFFPGDGTAQASTGPIACNDVVIPANNATVVPSLRALCPALVAGTAFGFLHAQSAPSSDGMYSDIPVFAAFSRVSNPQGNGFTVEAFPAHTFTSATSVVNGLRRLAASGSSPAFQTNCFLANLNQLDPAGAPLPKRINYKLVYGGNEWNGFVDLPPGRLVRLLDIFATAGAPAGDYNDAGLILTASTPAGGDASRPGLMAFCTVQDNTSFGADFRVAKQAYGSLGIGSNDGMAARESVSKQDAQGRVFRILDGHSANTHVVYFKHPDTVQCQLLNPTTFAPLTAASGLEMRAAPQGATSEDDVAGGDNQTGTGPVYLGDKPARGGFNARYLIEVESNETNEGNFRDYALYCASGSGNTYGYDIIKYQENVDRF